MEKTEINNKIKELYLNIENLKRELRNIEFIENESLVGKYYKYSGNTNFVIGKIIGLGTYSPNQLRCMEIVKSLEDEEFDFWYEDMDLKTIDGNWITQEEFEKYKKEMLNEIDGIFR